MITELHLINFRNHLNYRARVAAPVVVVSGANGAGKTNILEAISLFAPGRSMRNCKLDEILANCQSISRDWGVHIRYRENAFSTGVSENSSRRLFKDNEVLKSQTEILQDIKVLWMLPRMENVFTDSCSVRRRFFDRICYNFNHEHAKNILRYEYYLKSRMKLLQQSDFPNCEWLDSIEANLAALSIVINEARRDALATLESEMASGDDSQALKPLLELVLVCDQSDYNEPFFRSAFANFRKRDTRSGRSNFGIHKEDISVRDSRKKQRAELCSTGEQKALLVALIIAQAKAIKKRSHIAPVMLMDEILSHFDSNKQNDILQEFAHLSSQIWITTTKDENELSGLLKHIDVAWLKLERS